MDFDFTDDQESLRDAVRRWVDKGFAFERRQRIAKAGGGDARGVRRARRTRASPGWRSRRRTAAWASAPSRRWW